VSRMVACAVAALLIAVVPSPALAADVVSRQVRNPDQLQEIAPNVMATKIAGQVSVIDGRTLWFPHSAAKVRLAGIDSCELPQWSYDPKQHGESRIPKPVPCGPLAKAWLKRTVGDARVICEILFHSDDGVVAGLCRANGRDLAIEMLRVGWARVKGPSPVPRDYLAWQKHAQSARYGMWTTYVLDMDEWRRKAVDRTLSRKPIADFNLLAERESEISPPFVDARKRPQRTDR
jgi:endonuclease YncB( thermonuclease family)